MQLINIFHVALRRCSNLLLKMKSIFFKTAIFSRLNAVLGHMVHCLGGGIVLKANMREQNFTQKTP